MAEDCIVTGKLSGTDGALFLRNDVEVEVLGTEIVLDKSKRSIVYEVNQSMSDENEELNSEQFSMRHGSAIRLCSSTSDVAVFVVSQDSGTGSVWNEKGRVYF